MNKDYLQLEFDNLGSEANYKLADPTLVDYYKRLNNREILINQDIDDGIVEWTQEIVEWNREDAIHQLRIRRSFQGFRPRAFCPFQFSFCVPPYCCCVCLITSMTSCTGISKCLHRASSVPNWMPFTFSP